MFRMRIRLFALLSALLLAVPGVTCCFAEAADAETPAAETPAGTLSDPDAYLAYRMELAPDAPYTAFVYEHNPADNPQAMADITINPEAVFGFSPSPESTRLKEFVDALDWTSPAEVAQARENRRKYHDSMSELYRMIEDMLGEAKPVEEIARAVSQRRNELRLEAAGNNAEELARTKKSNLETYGNELGPTPDSLYEKYGSWQEVLERALGTNPGMDACLGFYDECFELYEIPDK